jgi:carbamoyl-phosphate synthase large subunit
MKSTAVLVTGIGGGGHGEQILKALRLAETNYTIVGGDMSPHSKGLYEVDIAYILPPATDPDYIGTLLKICRRHSVSSVFHGSEPELKAMSAARRQIEEDGLFLPINPASVIDLCMDKVKTCDFLRAHGFHVSAYRRVSSRADLEEFDRLPAVLKPSIGGGGSANIFLAQTRDELVGLGHYMLSLYSEFIVQEYVGTPDSEFTVGVLADMDGEVLNSIAVKRSILSSLSNRIKVNNRTGRDDLGPVLALSSGISQGVIGRFPEVTKPCEQIAQALGCRGPLNIQCRFVNSRVYVFEINPRFSGTTSLRAMVGYNEPDVLIRKHLLGERITPNFAYSSGVITRGLTEVLMEPRDFPNGKDL